MNDPELILDSIVSTERAALDTYKFASSKKMGKGLAHLIYSLSSRHRQILFHLKTLQAWNVEPGTSIPVSRNAARGLIVWKNCRETLRGLYSLEDDCKGMEAILHAEKATFAPTLELFSMYDGLKGSESLSQTILSLQRNNILQLKHVVARENANVAIQARERTGTI